MHHSGYLRPGRQRLETIVAMTGVSRVDDCVRVPRESMWTLFYLACALAISFLLFFVFALFFSRSCDFFSLALLIFF